MSEVARAGGATTAPSAWPFDYPTGLLEISPDELDRLSDVDLGIRPHQCVDEIEERRSALPPQCANRGR